MAAVLSRRLGKRSLLGARVAAPDGIVPEPPQIPGFSRRSRDGVPGSPNPGSPNPEFPNPGSPNPEFLTPGSPNSGSLHRHLHGQQVLLTSVDEQIPGFPTCWRGQDELQAPALPHPGIPERSVSSNIDVPKRRSLEPVDMDEMVAALVLTSLSCSPALTPSQAAGDPWKDGGDVSDSGSSTTSGHWSSVTSSPPHGSVTMSPPHGGVTSSPPHGGVTMSPPHGGVTSSPPHGGVTMSPPHGGVTSSPPHGGVTMSPLHCAGSVTVSPLHGSASASPLHGGVTTSPPYSTATMSPPHGSATTSPPHQTVTTSPPTDDGFDTDPEPSPPEEPARRQRKHALVMFKCLWPGCGKVLRSGVGIKRHVRTRHLGDGSEREEDFYYTELQVTPEPPTELPPPAVTGAAGVTGVTSVPAVPGATPCSAPIVIPGQPGLSHSAPPGSFWHIQADHAYQALPSIQIPVSPHIFTSISWAAATSTLPSLSPVRSRSLSLSEPQAPPLLQPQLLVASPPRVSLSSRKIRGEAKKCRKVYGIEHRDQWCTACRWKKACQRFLD